MLEPEKIKENWDKFENLCFSLLGHRTGMNELVDSIKEELALCPASGRLDFHNAFPGGLCDHSLRVLNNAAKLTKEHGWTGKFSKESLILSALFHDVGKVGMPTDKGWIPYYIPQESDWHRDKLGEIYKHNDKLPYMSVPQRSVFIMQYFNVKLSYDEYLAILLNDGWVLQENKGYCLKEPPLAHVIMTADYISTFQEKKL